MNINDRRGRTILELEAAGGLPEFVKEASFTGEEDLRKKPVTAFADRKERKYPVDTSDLAFISALEAEKEGAMEDPLVAERIYTAVSLWDIEEELDNYRTRAGERIEKAANALPEAVEIVYTDEESNVPFHRTTIRTAEDAGKVMEDLMQCKTGSSVPKYTRKERAQVALQLLNNAEKLGSSVEARDAMEMLSGRGFSDKESALECLENSMLLCKNIPEISEKLASVMEDLDNNTVWFVPPEECDRVCRIVDWTVRELNLGKNAGMESFPERIMHKYTPSDNEKFRDNSITLANGCVVSRPALAEHKEAASIRLRDVCGIECPEDIKVSELADKLAGLSGREADDFRLSLDDAAADKLIL